MSKENPIYGGFGDSLVDDALMILLACISIGLLVFEAVAFQTREQQHVLEVADQCIAFIFLGEWTLRFINAPEKKVFVKKHWWELLASIPLTTEMLSGLQGVNALRIVRVIRLLRIVRLFARVKVILSFAEKRFKDARLIYFTFVAGILVLSGSLGFHYMESGHNPNVHSLWDSFWWTCVTITTVGYGDIYPVTTGGRILAILLMLGGIATFSTITAMIAAKLMQPSGEDNLK